MEMRNKEVDRNLQSNIIDLWKINKQYHKRVDGKNLDSIIEIFKRFAPHGHDFLEEQNLLAPTCQREFGTKCWSQHSP